jgi:hypothetical protein
MKIFKNDVQAIIDSPFIDGHDGSILLGFSLSEGVYEPSGNPILAFQLGLLFATLTITISEYNKN